MRNAISSETRSLGLIIWGSLRLQAVLLKDFSVAADLIEIIDFARSRRACGVRRRKDKYPSVCNSFTGVAAVGPPGTDESKTSSFRGFTLRNKSQLDFVTPSATSDTINARLILPNLALLSQIKAEDWITERKRNADGHKSEISRRNKEDNYVWYMNNKIFNAMHSALS